MACAHLLTIVLGVFAISGSAFALASDTAENPVEACSPKNLKSSVSVDGYAFRSYLSKDYGSCLKVIHGGKVIFRRTSDSWSGFVLGQPTSKKEDKEIPAISEGADLTGNGRPDMIVSFWSGGANCCSSHYVFELEPRFRNVITIQDAHDDLAHFELYPDGKYYYLLEDFTFAHWVSCTFCSPTAHLILRIVDDGKVGRLVLAWDKMAKSAPSSEQWQLKVNEVKSLIDSPNPEFDPDASLWNEVLRLIFSGHSELAWKFAAEVAPKGTKRTDLCSFCSNFKRDPFWPQIGPMLKSIPSACSNAKPSVIF